MRSKLVMTFVFITLFINHTFAQTNKNNTLDNRVNIVFGLTQLAANGFNIEGNVFINRLAFDYSHGVSLNFSNAMLEEGADKAQNLAIHLPWTTGFGVGYRFNNWLNLRAEPKWHKFELYYEGDEQTVTNLIGDYTTFTLGLGLYANLRPFKNKDNFLKGFMIAPNVRWWPRVSSSIDGNTFDYDNRTTDQMETHEARQIGIGNTPFFGNMSIGYSIEF